VPLELYTSDGQLLTFLSTVTTFGTALDLTAAELSIEAFLPATKRPPRHCADKTPVNAQTSIESGDMETRYIAVAAAVLVAGLAGCSSPAPALGSTTAKVTIDGKGTGNPARGEVLSDRVGVDH